jgi:hypothetical protein
MLLNFVLGLCDKDPSIKSIVLHVQVSMSRQIYYKCSRLTTKALLSSTRILVSSVKELSKNTTRRFNLIVPIFWRRK